MKRVLSILMSALILVSFGCKDDDIITDPEPEPGKYETGFFVTNEGPFNQGTGTITFFDTDREVATQNIYQAENNDAVLGNIVQSLGSTTDNYYAVANNANSVVVIDRTDFTRKTTIEGFELPRYFVSNDGEVGYVSQWGSDGLTGSVAIVDLSNNTITSTIPTGMGAENMMINDNKLYVMNAGGFGTDKHVSVINLTDKTIEKQIEVGNNPNSIQEDKDGAFWVLSNGITDWTDPTASIPGTLAKIVNDEVVAEFEIALGAKNLQINAAGDQLFYVTGTDIMKVSIEPNSVPESMVAQSCYNLALNTATSILYCSDAKDFSSNGEVIAFDMSGNILYSFETGIIPGSFKFD